MCTWNTKLQRLKKAWLVNTVVIKEYNFESNFNLKDFQMLSEHCIGWMDNDDDNRKCRLFVVSSSMYDLKNSQCSLHSSMLNVN